MKFYTPKTTSLIMAVIGILCLIFSNFTTLPLTIITVATLTGLVYLLWYRERTTDNPYPTMIGLIPGHYLLLLAFYLTGTPGVFLLVLWGLLILSTLGYDYTTNTGDNTTKGKLTKIFLYCIIWGVIVVLFQELLIYGLELKELGILSIRLGISIAGSIWIAIGVLRINSGYTERR